MSHGDVDQSTRAERIETLLQRIVEVPDLNLRSQMEELIQSLLNLFGDGLSRVLELTEQSMAGQDLIAGFAQDELIGSLLLLYGLHPDDIETRVIRAVEGIRGYVEQHGGRVELLGISGGVAQVRLNSAGCSSSASALQSAIEQALYAAAPDLGGVQVDDGAAPRLITLTRRRKMSAAV